MPRDWTKTLGKGAAVSMLLTALGGCVYTERVVEVEKPAPVVVATPAPAVVAVTSSPNQVAYPEGRWQLQGDGRNMPYYWVWIPAGLAPPAPPAYPYPSGVVVASTPVSDRVAYTDGRWQLYGDGKSTPFYWVWIPAGRTVALYPAPPPLPQPQSR